MTITIRLDSFDIPEKRRDTSKLENVHWLCRNLGIRNSDHPMFKVVLDQLKEMSCRWR